MLVFFVPRGARPFMVILALIVVIVTALIGGHRSVSVVSGPAPSDPYLAGMHAEPVTFGADYRGQDDTARLVKPGFNFHTGDHIAWTVTLATPAGVGDIRVVGVRLLDGTSIPETTDVDAGPTDVYYGRTSAFTKTGEYSLRVYAGGSLAGEGRFNVDAPVPTPTPTPKLRPAPRY